MPLTIIVTRDVADRTRGFLASVMVEIAVGVYVSPRMTTAVRDRVRRVLTEWHDAEPSGGVVIAWRESDRSGGLGLHHIGEVPRELVDLDGLLVVRRRTSPRH